MDATRDELLAGLGAPAGQCEWCEFARLNHTRRRTVYLRCGRSTTDDRFVRYPRLPMYGCPGFAPVGQAER